MRAAILACLPLALGCGVLVDPCQQCKDEGRLKQRCHQGIEQVPYCPGLRERANCAGYIESASCFSTGQVCMNGACAAPPGGCGIPDAGTRLCRNRCESPSVMITDCASFNEQPCDTSTNCLGCTWKEPCPEGTTCKDILGCVPPTE